MSEQETYRAFTNTIKPFTPEGLVDACVRELPIHLQWRPWQQKELNHGTALLQSTESMNAYMAAYGEMQSINAELLC